MNKNIFSFPFFIYIFLVLGFKSYSQSIDSADYYYQKMLQPVSNSDIPLAIQYYTFQTEKHLSNKKYYKAIGALRMIAIGEYEIGNIYDSEKAIVQAVEIIENSNQTDTLIESRKGLYNQLGHIYRSTKEPAKAIEAYNLALKYSKNTSDSLTIINNKATIYKDTKDYLQAQNLLQSALTNNNIEAYPLQSAMLLDNLGFIQSKLNNPEAFNNLTKAFTIRDSLMDVKGIYSSNKNLALYYLEQNEIQLAQSFANKAFDAANTMNSLTYLEDALSLSIMMADDPKIAQFKIISDSIAKQKQIAQNKNAYLKYNVEKERENTIAALLEKEEQKNEKLILLLLGTIISFISIYIFFKLKRKHKSEKIIQVHNTESRISKKVHDEVANDVFQLMAKIQGNLNHRESLLDDLEKIYHKTRDISKENSAIEIEMDFSSQLNDLFLNYQNEIVTIITRNITKIEWENTSEIKKITIYRVLQELLTNMKKYSSASAVVFTFQQKNNKINIDYVDNGVGCIIKNKNGLQNAENRIHAVNGTITFESDPGKGFKSNITI